jgi:hypothetical protein
MQGSDSETFGYKCAWLAIQTRDPAAVMEALELSDRREVDRAEGVAGAYAGQLFVTSPVDGWVLVASTSLGDATCDAEGHPDLETFAERLETTSRRLGVPCQYFATQRVVELHGWAVAEPSGLRRAFVYSGERGEVLFDEGQADETEPSELRLSGDPNAAADEPPLTMDVVPNEEHVMEVARRWSLAPVEVELPARGWLARRSGLWSAPVREAPVAPRAVPAAQTHAAPACPRRWSDNVWLASLSLVGCLYCLVVGVRSSSYGWIAAAAACSLPPMLWLDQRLRRWLP